MSENLNFYFAQSEQVYKGEFVVARIKNIEQVTGKMKFEDTQTIFEGDEDLSSLLIGFGIARKIAVEDGRVLMIFNTNQGITLPDNVTGVNDL